MKLVTSAVRAKDGEGSVTLRPDVPEDLWHAYNLISVGDTLTATTVRKVTKESTTGSTSSQKRRTRLTLLVEDTSFDAGTCVVRVRGRNVTENKFVKMGAYHTIDLELSKDFTLAKGRWDAVYLERLDLATNIAKQADVACVVMSLGLAHVCLISGEMTVVRAKIEQSVPKKRIGSSGHRKGVERFFELVMDAVLRHVDFSVVKALIIASPGYVKDDFRTYLVNKAAERGIRSIRDAASQIMVAHASSGHRRALQEVLQNQELLTQLADTKALKEVAALQHFFELLNTDMSRAFYGFKHVSAACERGAVDTLLVTDSLFRSLEEGTRRAYVDLVEAAREQGATVHVFSSLHVSGEALEQITGVAAVLRFPLPDLDGVNDAVQDMDSDGDYDSDDTVDGDAAVGVGTGTGAGAGAGAGAGVGAGVGTGAGGGASAGGAASTSALSSSGAPAAAASAIARGSGARPAPGT